MGAPAAVVAGKIITSIVVSKVATKVAQKVGLSDNAAGLVGAVAGVYVGSQVGAGGSTPSADIAADPSIANSAQPPAVAGTPSPHVDSPILGNGPAAVSPNAGGGMLSEGVSPPEVVPPPVTSAAPTTDIPPAAAAGVNKGDSWWSKLFTPEKTMDLIMGGVKGYGQAGIRKEELEYPEKVAKRNARDWTANNPDSGGGFLSLGRNYPTQSGG